MTRINRTYVVFVCLFSARDIYEYLSLKLELSNLTAYTKNITKFKKAIKNRHKTKSVRFKCVNLRS